MLTLVVVWYAATLLVGLAALPLTTWLCPDWPDRGASLALPTGFAILTLTGFWVGQVRFGPYAAVLGVLVLAVVGLAAQRYGPGADPCAARAPAAVFTVAFLVMLTVRVLGPAITPYAGEQFLDFGLIHAVRRTATLPPEDIWFAGERLRYYYGGPLLSGLLTWLTDTPPRYAYNLVLPVIFGSMAAAAYGLAAAMAAAGDRSSRFAGTLAVLLVAFSGTLATPLRALSSYLPHDVAAESLVVLYQGFRMPYPEAVEAGRYLAGGEFSYWAGRYVIPHTPNVFPFWTYVNGDLRPHMYAYQFLLLGAAVCFVYYRTDEARLTRRRLLLVGALPVVGGLLGLVNTWDLPALAGVTWLSLTFAPADPVTLLPATLRTRLPDAEGLVGEGRRTLVAATVAAVVALLSVLWVAPFFLFHTAENEGLAFPGPGSGLGGLVLVWGAFLVVFALAALLLLSEWDRRRRVALVVTVGGALLVAVVVGRPALALFGPLVVGGWWVARRGRTRSFAIVLVVGGAGLLLFTELAYARVWPYDPNAPRWNTIYKVALQVWVLWGVAAAVAAASVAERVRGAASVSPPTFDGRRTLAATALALVLVSALVFPAFAFAGHLDQFVPADRPAEPSLNATVDIGEGQSGRLAAARWLRTETTGQPTLASRPTNASVYSWQDGANAVSVLSGVPTLAGWEHAAGYHGREAYYERAARAESVYLGNWSAANTTLRELAVDYVLYGPAEFDAYGYWDHADRPGILVAYENDAVTIYAVNRSALAE